MVLPPFALARNALGSKTGFRARFIAEFLVRKEPEKTGKNMSVKYGTRPLCRVAYQTNEFYVNSLPKSRASPHPRNRLHSPKLPPDLPSDQRERTGSFSFLHL